MTGHDITPAITLGGEDGAQMRYYAFAGNDYSPGETGWVLVVEGGPHLLDPQAITIAEVMGDLEVTVPPDDLPAIREILRIKSEEMIEALERGEVAPTQRDDEPSAVERLDQLRADFRTVFAAQAGDEPWTEEELEGGRRAAAAVRAYFEAQEVELRSLTSDGPVELFDADVTYEIDEDDWATSPIIETGPRWIQLSIPLVADPSMRLRAAAADLLDTWGRPYFFLRTTEDDSGTGALTTCWRIPVEDATSADLLAELDERLFTHLWISAEVMGELEAIEPFQQFERAPQRISEA